MRTYSRFFLVLLNVIWIGAAGQSIKVLDAIDNTPISYASVLSDSTYLGNTNERGELIIPTDIDSICIQHINYTQECYSRPYPAAIALKSGIALQGISVRASRDAPAIRNIPIQTSIINPALPSSHIRLNAADIASQATGVQVQKSQQGGGSPMIRGFAANRILLIIDGVRMNTAIFRSGNVQNLINIDPHHLSSMRVHMGPHSLLYGSDALGGVIDIQSIRPDHFSGSGVHGKVGTQFISANNQLSFHGLISYKQNKWSYVGDFQYSHYGDLIMGSHGPDRYLRNQYASRLNGRDTLITNSNPRVQNASGYTQWNTRHIISYDINNALTLDYGYYHSSTSDILRYDRLIQPGLGTYSLQNAEWYYGPQKWSMHRLGLSQKAQINKSNWSVQIARQNFKESRNDRRFNSENLRSRTETVQAYSLNIDLRSRQDKSFNWTTGIEGVYNNVGSQAMSININTSESRLIPSRYPDGSSWYALGIYSQVGYYLTERLGMSAGLRNTVTGIQADADDRLDELPVLDLDQNSQALSASLGLNYTINNQWSSSVTFSSAFRAPNIDDAAKIFDSEPGSVLIPNPDLNPEYSYSIELGLRKHYGRVTTRVNLFYTWIENILDRAPIRFQGQDSILYDGVLSQILSVQNLQNGYVYGLESEVGIKISNRIKWLQQFSYQQGLESTQNGDFPIRHITPMMYRSTLHYASGNWRGEISWVYSGSISAENLAPSEVAKPYLYDLNSAGDPFSPSWNDLSASVHYSIKKLNAQLGFFNILDRRYRTYSSGIAAPGRGVSVALKYEF